ncbi:unnamed protein product [Allacma fusca]|uniref:Uncharacterized protein n=1 Tax=Allacma fusca TaxID=39272 RepID=A0A8J2JGI2_9HEXA|nr:unnamed protein product [Allacma fusca]
MLIAGTGFKPQSWFSLIHESINPDRIKRTESFECNRRATMSKCFHGPPDTVCEGSSTTVIIISSIVELEWIPIS